MTSPPHFCDVILSKLFQLFALVLRNADKSTVRPFIPCSARHFKKGAKCAGSVGHPMTKMLSASGGLRPPDQGLCPWTPLGALSPDPRYRLVLCTRHGAPNSFCRLWSSCLEPPPLILTSLRLWQNLWISLVMICLVSYVHQRMLQTIYFHLLGTVPVWELEDIHTAAGIFYWSS